MTPPVNTSVSQVKGVAPSNHDVATTIDELKLEILAAIGKWAIAIITSIIGVTIVAMSQWGAMVGRIEKLETWKAERTQPIEKYYEDQRTNGERMARIEAKLDALTEKIK